jgi:hypothetical protein
VARFGSAIRPARLGDRRDRAWWEKVEQSPGCWTWRAAKSGAGYGSFWNGSYVVLAHRYGYEMLRGEIPPDHDLDHVCRNPSCVKPVHLDAVTRLEHKRRDAPVTHCRKGHEFTPENTCIYPKSGAKLCTICHPRRQPTAYRQPPMTLWHAEAAEMYRQGATQQEIAEALSKDASTVCRALQRMEVAARPLDISIDRGMFAELAEAGMTRMGLAEVFGCDAQVISRRAAEWMPDHVFPVGRPSDAHREWERMTIKELK